MSFLSNPHLLCWRKTSLPLNVVSGTKARGSTFSQVWMESSFNAKRNLANKEMNASRNKK